MSTKRGSSSKKSFFSGQDAREIAKEFNASLGVCYDEGFSDEKSLRVCCAIDVITELLVIPELPEAVLKKSGIDLSIQVETLYRKVKGIADPEANEKLKQSITRFFKACASLPDSLKLEVTLKKLQDHISGQEIMENSLLETVTVALKRLNNQQAIENSLRALKIFLSFEEHKRKSGDTNIPQFLNRSLLTTDAVLKQWEDLIYASFISIKNLQNNNAAYLKLLDILIFVASLGDSLRLEIVKSGGIRVLMQKMKEDKNITCESARKSLTLLRDLCYKDSSTSSLMGHHEVENHMLIVLQKFRGEREIENLVSQILEQAIYGFDLDLENFEENMKQTKVKLGAYIGELLGEEDLEKAQYNVGIVHFYSLMQVFTRRLLQLQIHDTLLDIIKKEISLKVESLKEAKVLEEHERILSDCLIVLKRVIQLPETASNDKKTKENIPNKLVSILMPCLLSILTDRQEMKTAVEQAIECFRVFANNETTKQATVNFALKANLTDKLTILKETYRDDFKLVKILNTLYFLFAKFTTDNNNSSQKNSFVSTLVKQFSAKTTQNKQEQRRNMEYLNDLAEIPTTAKAIIEQGGISFIKNYLKEENKDSKKSHLADSGKIEEHVYNLAEVNEEDDVDEDDESRQSESFSADEISRKDDIAGNGTGNSKEPSNPVEILRKLIQNHNEDIDKFINADIIQEVLKYLRLQSQNRDTVFATLRVLQSCSEEPKTLIILDQNKALESIFIALNQHPTDSDICGLAGLILGKLNAEQLSQDVKEQYSDMGDSFDPKDEDTIEGIRQANIYLGNLLTALPAEESDELIQSNKLVVSALDKILRPDLPSNFMASFLLLLIRMCNQGEQTKTLIRESGIPSKVVKFMVKYAAEEEPTRLSEFSMQCLYAMIGGNRQENLLCSLDSSDGRDYELESREILKDYLGQLSNLLNSAEVIDSIVKSMYSEKTQLDRPKKGSRKWNCVQQGSDLLGRLLQCDEELFGEMIPKVAGEERIFGIWEQMIQEERSLPLKSIAFAKMGYAMSELCRVSQAFFTRYSSEIQLGWLVETILNVKSGSDELTNDSNQQITLMNILKFLNIFLNSSFDKTRLVNANLPSALFKLFQRLSTRSLETFESSDMICLLFSETCSVLERVLEDSTLCHDLTKNNLIAEIIDFAGKFPRDDHSKIRREDDPSTTDDIIGSEGFLERSTESCYKLLNSALNQSKYAAYASRVYSMNNPLVTLAAVQKVSAYSLTKLLQILYSLIVCYEESEPLAFSEPLVEVKNRNKYNSDIETISKVVKQYPKIPILQILLEDLLKVQKLLLANDTKALAALRAQIYGEVLVEEKIEEEIKQIGEKAEQYVEQVKQEQKVKDEGKQILFEDLHKDDDWEESNPGNSITDVMKILEKIASSLEKLSLVIACGQPAEENQLRLNIKLLEMARSITIDDATALKAHNIGITDYLLNLIISIDLLPADFAAAVAKTLAHLTKFPKALKKIENDIDFADSFTVFLTLVLDEQSPVPSIKTLVDYKEATLGVLDAMKNITAVDACIMKIVSKLGVQQCIALFEKSQDMIEILIKDVDILDKLSYHNKEALELCAGRLTPYVNAFSIKHSSNIEALKVFALLGGTLCRDTKSQQKLGADAFHKTILVGMSKFPDDKMLITNSFYALSGLAYNNKENCNAAVSNNVLQYVKENMKKFMAEHQVIETICSLLSNLTFKNEEAKTKLGEIGVTDLLGAIFEFYANQRTLNSKTTKQVLRAIGNSSLTIENATLIVKSRFVPLSIQIITKMNFQEEGDVLRYCVDVIGNLASHSENINHENTEQMQKDGVIQLIIKIIQENQLNSEIIASCIDALDGLIQNKNISIQVAESDTILIILKIIKSQDWNESILVKCTRVISNISVVKQNIDQLLKFELPLVIGNLLKNLPKANDKIINYCFRILNRIAAEKVKEKQMLQSGLIEALGEGLTHSSVNPDCIFNYISLLKSLAKLPNAVQLIGEKSVGNAILRANENKLNYDIVGVSLILIQRVIKCKAAVANIVESGGMDFLVYIAKNKISDVPLAQIALDNLRTIIPMDEKYRQAARAFEDDLNGLILKSKDLTVSEYIRNCLFALLNQKENAAEVSNTKQKKQQSTDLTQQQKDLLLNGINVKLFRTDGSNKSAIVKLNSKMTEIMAYKKGGSVKPKYQFALLDITDYKFNYADKNKVWELSTFSKAGGLFSKKPNPECCVTIFGPTVDNERKSICIECQNVEVKNSFQEAFLIHYEKVKGQQDSLLVTASTLRSSTNK